MENMTEEQKEYLAMQLMNQVSKLSMYVFVSFVILIPSRKNGCFGSQLDPRR